MTIINKVLKEISEYNANKFSPKEKKLADNYSKLFPSFMKDLVCIIPISQYFANTHNVADAKYKNLEGIVVQPAEALGLEELENTNSRKEAELLLAKLIGGISVDPDNSHNVIFIKAK